MVGAFREPSCGRRTQPIHSIPYSVAQPLERGSNNYYSIIQGEFDMDQNINFYGIILMLRKLRDNDFFTEKELRKVAARIAAESGVELIISL